MILLSEAVKNARLTALSNAIDSNSATLIFYAGTVPSNLAAITDQVPLCTLVFPNPSLASVAASTLTFQPLAEQQITASGEVTFARITATNGTAIADLDIGDLNSSAHLRLPTTTLYQGSLLRLDNWQISEL